MSTYTPIASQTLSSAAASVTFSGIPQNYTDLVVVINAVNASSGYGEVWARIGNGSVDSGTNYSRTVLRGNGSSATSFRGTNENYIYMDNAYAGSGSGNAIMQFQNYSNTTTNKTILIRTNGAGNHVNAQVELWRSTSAVNIITLYADSNSFQSGSTFNLYGIDASLSAQAKATGGSSIYTDGTYWYHIFNQSGTFTPSVALSNVDYLVVAGGGGGGKNWAGGGGAGGYRYLTSQSFTANTNYTVTVGAGGAGATTTTAQNAGSNSSFNSTSATGGGAGGNNQASPTSGGSGGGGAYTGEPGVSTNGAAGNAGSYSPVEGYAGGSGYNGSTRNSSAGGGGSSAVGANAVNDAAGAGGAGTSNSITGSAVTYAGGGGGGGYTPTGTYPAGAGGSGGGGAGGQGNGTTGTAGTANTGGGGGGGAGGNGNGGAGGSGIVIVRYAV